MYDINFFANIRYVAIVQTLNFQFRYKLRQIYGAVYLKPR